MHTLASFAAALTRLVATMPMAEHRALDHAARVVQDEAKRVLGTYDYDWPQLAERTQQARSRAGYPANEPGLVSGAMRESIERTVGHKEAHVGSNDDHIVYFDIGTRRQPPRPVFVPASMHKGEEVAHAIGRNIHAHLLSGPQGA